MKKFEMRSIRVVYCDWCHLEIKGNFSTIRYPDKDEMDFHHDYQEDGSCLDQHKASICAKPSTATKSLQKDVRNVVNANPESID